MNVRPARPLASDVIQAPAAIVHYPHALVQPKAQPQRHELDEERRRRQYEADRHQHVPGVVAELRINGLKAPFWQALAVRRRWGAASSRASEGRRDLFQRGWYGDDCDASGRAAAARVEFTARAMRSPRSASTPLSEAG